MGQQAEGAGRPAAELQRRLALHDEIRRCQSRRFLRQLADNLRGAIERDIPDRDERPRRQGELQEVATHDRRAHAGSEASDQRQGELRIRLDGQNARPQPRQLGGDCAAARADLDDGVDAAWLDVAEQPPHQRRVGDEILGMRQFDARRRAGSAPRRNLGHVVVLWSARSRHDWRRTVSRVTGEPPVIRFRSVVRAARLHSYIPGRYRPHTATSAAIISPSVAPALSAASICSQ